MDGRYWRQRSDFMYYRYIEAIVAGVALDATSMLDVGSQGMPYIEEFDWIPNRVTIDITRPYRSEAVKGIKGDFFTYQPERKFDVVTCFQVLEHIEDAQLFAKRLFEVGNSVLISVPYKWPENATSYHLHDPVDEEKLEAWTGRKADYSVVVSELFLPRKGRRIISYYHGDRGKFDINSARKAMQGFMENEK